MVSMLTLSVVDRGFEPRSCQSKNYKIVFCRFSAKHAALMKKSKDWLARNEDNVSDWGDMSISELALSKSISACWSSTKRLLIIISLKLTCSRHDIVGNC